jgi:hypothetical protein
MTRKYIEPSIYYNKTIQNSARKKTDITGNTTSRQPQDNHKIKKSKARHQEDNKIPYPRGFQTQLLPQTASGIGSLSTEDETRQERQDKAKQDKTRQNKARQGKIKQNKTRQD